MSSKRVVSPARQKLTSKFKKETDEAARIRYGTMRKVKFSDWSDVGRFVKYAEDHLAVAKVAQKQLGYWESLYELFTKGRTALPTGTDLTSAQQNQIKELEKEINDLPSRERFSLARSVECRHRETLDLLAKMSNEGLLPPQKACTTPLSESKNGNGGRARQGWAVAYGDDNLPLIEGGQLKLYATAPSPPGSEFLQALDEASKVKTEYGSMGKLGFFLGYSSQMMLNHLARRPFRNSLTDKEASKIQATNEMIQFLQQEWRSKTESTMKNDQQKSLNSVDEEAKQGKETPPNPAINQPLIPASPQGATYTPSIINNITIQGAMNGDIGFQRLDSMREEEPPQDRGFPGKYPRNQEKPGPARNVEKSRQI